MTSFADLHKKAYGTQHIKPKHHWMLDIPSQMRRDGLVLDAFVIERQHLTVKGVAEHVRNTSNFEASCLASLLTVQVHNAQEFEAVDRLIGRAGRLEGHPGALIADKLAIHSFQVRVDDIVLRGPQAGIVMACCCEASALYVFVTPLLEQTAVTQHAATFRRTGHLDVWRAADLRLSLAWRCEADGSLLVLRA